MTISTSLKGPSLVSACRSIYLEQHLNEGPKKPSTLCFYGVKKYASTAQAGLTRKKTADQRILLKLGPKDPFAKTYI